MKPKFNSFNVGVHGFFFLERLLFTIIIIIINTIIIIIIIFIVIKLIISSKNKVLSFLTDPFSKPRKIFFKDDRAPFDGIPFMTIGSKILDCQHGPDRKKNAKDKLSRQKVGKVW